MTAPGILRRSPLHGLLGQWVESGAWSNWNGVALPAVFTSAEAEIDAFESRAVMADLSPLRTYLVSGPEAGAYLDRLCTRSVNDLLPGRCQGVLMTDDLGRVIDLATLYRFDDQSFQLVGEARLLTWLEAGLADFAVAIDDASEALCALGLSGPMSASVLEAAGLGGGGDLAPGEMQLVDDGEQPIYVCRRGLGAPHGYEIWYQREHGEEIARRLMIQGAEFGLQPLGNRVREGLLTIAGVPRLGAEFESALVSTEPRNLYTPYELGLGESVQIHRRRFNGSQALMELAAREPARRFLRLEIEGGALPAGTDLFDKERRVGRVTSSFHADLLLGTPAIGVIEAARATAGDTLQAEFVAPAPGGQVIVERTARILGPLVETPGPRC